MGGPVGRLNGSFSAADVFVNDMFGMFCTSGCTIGYVGPNWNQWMFWNVIREGSSFIY